MPLATRPSVSYEAHSNYLRSLRDRLSGLIVINDRTFVRILGQAISCTPMAHRPDIWTSFAMVRLARRFRANDYEAFISLCHLLLQDAIEIQLRRKPKDSGNLAFNRMCDRLAKWLETLCERMIRIEHADGIPLQELRATTELLASANLYSQSFASDVLKPATDALLCLALLCLSTRHLLSSATYTTLTTMLRDHRDTDADTFNPIISIALANISKKDEGHLSLMSSQIDVSFASMRDWAVRLRTHKLHLLEAWFWSNALAHIEGLCPEVGSHHISTLHRHPWADELERLRGETVAKIEKAERLHFANLGADSWGVERTPSKTTSVATASQFRWEELVGCWVLRTPLPIKPRRRPKRTLPEISDDEEDVNSLRQHNAKRPCLTDTPKKRRPRAPSISSATSLSSYASTRSSRMSMTMSPRKTESLLRLSTPDDENIQPLPSSKIEKLKVARRRSSFASVLADAKSNRVVLHVDRDDVAEHKCSLREIDKPSRREQIRGNYARPKPDLARQSMVPTASAVDLYQLSSDDLDLFAHRLSEW